MFLFIECLICFIISFSNDVMRLRSSSGETSSFLLFSGLNTHFIIFVVILIYKLRMSRIKIPRSVTEQTKNENTEKCQDNIIHSV